MKDIQELTDKLLDANETVRILECRSGWGVFVWNGIDKSQNYEDRGETIAYSSDSGGFVGMLEKAVELLGELNKTEASNGL